MKLLPFSATDAPIVATWASSAAESTQWCGVADVTAERVLEWGASADVLPYALVAGGALAGYGELWVDDEEGEVELARLIVAPTHRGRGLGRRLVTLLAAEGRTRHASVFLRVHPDNDRALHCYLGAGFAPVDPARATEWNRPQPVAYRWLTAPAAPSPGSSP